MKPYNLKAVRVRGDSKTHRCGFHDCAICGEDKVVRTYKSNTAVRHRAKLELKAEVLG